MLHHVPNMYSMLYFVWCVSEILSNKAWKFPQYIQNCSFQILVQHVVFHQESKIYTSDTSGKNFPCNFKFVFDFLLDNNAL